MKFDQVNLFTFEDGEPFPEVPLGFGLPDEIVCVTRHVDPERLPIAYSQGIFPWYEEGQPVFWWMTSPRMVLETKNFKVHHALKKRLKKAFQYLYGDKRLSIRLDSCTEDVIRNCSLPRSEEEPGTWITEEMIQAYVQLAKQDMVHSVEVFLNDTLAGGLYGVSLGRMFYGESMFTHFSDLSKIALATLVAICRQDDIPWIDCQQETQHLKSLGASPVSLEEFKHHLDEYCPLPPVYWQKYRNKELNELLGVFCDQ